MSNTVIKVENLSKLYRLGEVGTGTLSHDLNRWWAGIRGKEDPFLKVGKVNDRTVKAAKGEHIWAIKDINFEVKQGEVLGIIGKNGAGKSTLLKILSRITAPTTGEIKIKGRVGSLLEVGTGFHPEMTGRENIYMNGTILGMTRKEISAKLDDIVDFAGIAKFLDTPVKRFSSGMMVRLGFAVAAFLEPEILIVDEVLAVGDAEFQKRAIGKMQDISSKGGRTVLFVSHNMASVKAICNNGIVLNNGNVIESGEITYCIDQYLKGKNIQKLDFFSNGFTLSEFSILESNQKTVISSSSSVIIKGHITGSCILEKPYIILNIKNSHLINVLLLSSRLSQIEIDYFKKELHFSIHINSLNLMPGEYSVDIRLLSLVGKPIVAWDKIYDFKIESDTDYGSLSMPSISNRGIVFARSKWIVSTE